jgi:hypothetical protein
MARAENVQTLSVTAGAAVAIYRFLQLQTDGKFDQVGVAQARADGVSAEATIDGDGDTIAMAQMQGIMKVEAGDAVTVGSVVASDDEGRAIVAVATAGNFKLGVALTASGAAGEIIEVLLHSPSEDGGGS